MKRISVLVIDDNDLLRETLQLALTRLGYDVTAAANVADARQRYDERPADLVLTDQEGLESIEQFRRKHPTLKVVAMSAAGRIDAREFAAIAKKMGADRTLIKPFSIQEFADAVRALLSPPSTHDPAQPEKPDDAGPQ